jgi:hypothetical protein
MVSIDGTWKARYAVEQKGPFDTEEGDPGEAGVMIFAGANIFGTDPLGGSYRGRFTLSESGVFQARVLVTHEDPEWPPVFEGLSFPFEMEFAGEFRSPDYFSARGSVIGFPEHKMVVNLKRLER